MTLAHNHTEITWKQEGDGRLLDLKRHIVTMQYISYNENKKLHYFVTSLTVLELVMYQFQGHFHVKILK